MFSSSSTTAPPPPSHAITALVVSVPDPFTQLLRTYPPRSIVSASLARTQRILELHGRIAAKLAALPDAQSQHEQNIAIAKRAQLVREKHQLELKISRAERSAIWELKQRLRDVQEAICLVEQ